MNFKNWLIQTGKATGTADKYSRAVAGVISRLAMDANLTSKYIDQVHSITELEKIYDELKNVDIYLDRNKHYKNMYSCALKAFIDYRRRESSDELEQDISSIIEDSSISSTEKTGFISARVGQGKYRSKLITYWGKCALTGYSDVRLLVASHIKPWRDSDNKERLDPYNGLLLLPNLDKAFALGYISFTEKGVIKTSEFIEAPQKLGIQKKMKINVVSQHQDYLAYHRENVFQKKNEYSGSE
jgi:predicted restriction endonuclease